MKPVEQPSAKKPERTGQQHATTPPIRSLSERIRASQHEADKLGPVDPDFDQKDFSNGL